MLRTYIAGLCLLVIVGVGFVSGQEPTNAHDAEQRRVEQELANARHNIEREPPPIAGEPAPRAGDHRILNDGRRLADRIRPNDRRLILPINQDRPAFMQPPVGTALEHFWYGAVPLVAVLDVTSTHSHLVFRDDMDGVATLDPTKLTGRNATAGDEKANWVVTTITARVETVVKDVDGVLREGEAVVFDDEGGTAMVRGVEVVGFVPWQQGFKSGKRYLVFGIIGGGKLVRTAVYEEPSRFAPLVGVGPQDDDTSLEAFNIVQAVTQLRLRGNN